MLTLSRLRAPWHNLHCLHNQIYNLYTVNIFTISCPVQLVVVKLPDLSVVCSVGSHSCSKRVRWETHPKLTGSGVRRVWQGLLCPFVESSLVYLKSGCWADGKIQCTRKSFRAPDFLKFFLPIGLRCAPPHPPLTYGNTLVTKPAILNQPIPHHIQFPSYNGQVMKHVFIIGSGWMGSELQHLSSELLVSSCVCKQEHTEKPANFNWELN